MNYKIVGSIKKGAGVRILEDKGSWIRVCVDDGREVWISKSAIDAAKTPPPLPAKAPQKHALKPLSPM